MLLQKFPKQFLFCPRFLLKTVTKCASQISETLFLRFFQISLKDGQKTLLRKFPKQLLSIKVVPDFS